VDTNATLLGVAALVSACGGIISTIVGVRQGKKSGAEECQEKLRAVEREAEELSDQLHEQRMKRIQ
jgi:hypothetical protein